MAQQRCAGSKPRNAVISLRLAHIITTSFLLTLCIRVKKVAAHVRLRLQTSRGPDPMAARQSHDLPCTGETRLFTWLQNNTDSVSVRFSSPCQRSIPFAVSNQIPQIRFGPPKIGLSMLMTRALNCTTSVFLKIAGVIRVKMF